MCQRDESVRRSRSSDTIVKLRRTIAAGSVGLGSPSTPGRKTAVNGLFPPFRRARAPLPEMTALRV
jgi:hypothetical protein